MYIRAEINGEKQQIYKSSDLAQGKISYYIGKNLKATDNVEIVLFNKDYEEIGRKNVVFSVEQTFDIKGNASRWFGSSRQEKLLITFRDNKMHIKENYNGQGWGTPMHSYYYTHRTYFSLNVTSVDGNVIYNHIWLGDSKVGAADLGTYDIPENSVITMYHAEGTSNKFGTSDDKDLKLTSGHTYTYKMEKNHLVFVNAE
ncbi:putative mucin/carbohydrate-binding domain-containing protein [Enterococcus sp. C76]|uniref:putative mucin/carbohydrate-binding domain-containing protein n=1 Tax=Enterococcus sp. C76 TaxID=3231334 RepID=UPI00349FF016